MASTNPDSMTNAQGEFKPSAPPSEPLTTKGHQVGQQVGNDAAPEFHAQVLPAGSAPKSSTYQPNPVNETPGQANNPDVVGEKSTALDMPGATSGDVHTGHGKPISGQTSAEIAHGGKTNNARERHGVEGSAATGGSGARLEENTEAKRLQEEHTATGPQSGHNVSIDGAEAKESVNAQQLAQ